MAERRPKPPRATLWWRCKACEEHGPNDPDMPLPKCPVGRGGAHELEWIAKESSDG